LRDVLRVDEGSVVVVFDGQGREAAARLVRGEGAILELALCGASMRHDRPACQFWLAQALPKGRIMDGLVEKAVELGVNKIIPLISERVVMRPAPEKCVERVARWKRIALSAARQCRTPWIPEISAMQSVPEAVAQLSRADVFFVGCTAPDSPSLRAAMEHAASRRPATIGMMIGPEGDWTDDEMERAIRGGAQPVSFGPLILRVETAALFGLSVLNARFRLAGNES